MTSPFDYRPPDFDPTNVFGRRVAAAAIDIVVFWGLILVLFSQLAVRDAEFGTTCDALSEAGISEVCFEADGETVFLDDDSDSVIISVFTVGYFVVAYGLLQGLAGGSPGKLVLGLRVVGDDGSPAGIGRSLLRSVLWVVDGAPYVVPGLVGFITALTSTGHRRVGDMVARTSVVARRSVGTEPVAPPADAPPTDAPPTTTPNPQPAPSAAPRPDWPTSPPEAPEAPDAPEAPEAPLSSGAGWPTAAPGGVPSTESADPGEISLGPDDREPAWMTDRPAEQPATEYKPQWDAARNTYILWEPGRAAWLQWDESMRTWKPIDT